MIVRAFLIVGLLVTGLFATLPVLTDAQTAPPQPDMSSYILTPPTPAFPRINGPSVYGERPGKPFTYAVPVTGDRPMFFAAHGLPDGLSIDHASGIVSGVVEEPGTYSVLIRARNAKGVAARTLRFVIGDAIALTPPMGWNNYNIYSWGVTEDDIVTSARAMVSSGLAEHGWTYINTDDTWQGAPDPITKALQGNERFPDIKGMVDTIHSLGLKAGIYSTPWVTSYGGRPGETADTPDRAWTGNGNGQRFGAYSFAQIDADQYAAWGIDYLKYDWYPDDVQHVREMSDALRSTSRDIVFSLSNSAVFDLAPQYVQYANAWRMTGDITDSYESIVENGFSGSRWAPYSGPGHWNDPDMMVVGVVGWGNPHPTRLTADEQYSHMSLWCLESAPLLLGCDLTKLDPFTLNLLTNDDVLAVDQDALGKAAVCVATEGGDTTVTGAAPYTTNLRSTTVPRLQVWAKPLEDGGTAVGLFNLGPDASQITADFDDLGITGSKTVVDLWRQKDLGRFSDSFTATVPSHGVVLVKIGK
jgi:alpha-galactosidase